MGKKNHSSASADPDHRENAEQAPSSGQRAREAALRLYRLEPPSGEDLARLALEQAMALTDSQFGYLGEAGNRPGRVRVLASAPRGALTWGDGNGPGCFSCADVPFWDLALRAGEPQIHNDCSGPGGAGTAILGHAFVTRHLAVPVLEGGDAVWFCGLANKRSDYLPQDALAVLGLMRDARRALEMGQARADYRRTHHEMENLRNHLEAVFNSIPDGMVTVDLDMRILTCNEAFWKMSGTVAVQTRDRHIAEILSGDPNPFVDVLQQTLSLGRSVKDFQIGYAFPGETPAKRLELNATPLVNASHEFCGAVLVIKDISRLVWLEHEQKRRLGFGKIIGRSPQIQKVFSLIQSLQEVMSTVLVTGESGTGKELVAESLHYNSPRKSKPMVCVNCSALTENLLESELFGHVRGAFTGALHDRVGRIQTAEGGTLFLDEIGDISPAVQLKLLRFLETKEFERVGESRPIKADVRIIAATNANLCAKIQQGDFRADLYYRLNVIKIHIPPLRERSGDIPLLVEHFIDFFNKTFDKRVQVVTPEVMKLLMEHPWPGNVRELKHCVEHAMAVCDGRIIHAKDLPGSMIESAEAGAGAARRPAGPDRPSRDELLRVMEKSGCKKARAARALGVSRTTLYRWLRELGV
ncbi:sigma-54-dependent Fis family transcriptional regulator [Desulfocurvus sp. DL9XJH121]